MFCVSAGFSWGMKNVADTNMMSGSKYAVEQDTVVILHTKHCFIIQFTAREVLSL